MEMVAVFFFFETDEGEETKDFCKQLLEISEKSKQ